MNEMVSLGLKYSGGQLLVLDQQRLPHSEIWLKCEKPDDMIEFIKSLKIRGAPLIGVAAALSLAQAVEKGLSHDAFILEARKMRAARPTAINLMKAVDHLKEIAERGFDSNAIVKGAEDLFNDDVHLCESMAAHGQNLLSEGDGVLTHCNTGGLATAGAGTALAVIKKAHAGGKKIHVYVDETRPLLQGARLTTWELTKADIPFTLVCDNMAGHLMKEGKVQKVIVGSDRIAKNGDFANKIGTYGLAVLAKFHGIPFFVVAPKTTLDPQCDSGEHIPIEERAHEEVRGVWSPASSHVYNPAFDVTPAALVTAYVLDSGLYHDPESLP